MGIHEGQQHLMVCLPAWDLQGNQARKLLKLSTKLLSETEGIPSTKIGEKMADVVRTLVKFDKVVMACFGV